jgi:hypothetical protein
MLWYEHLLGILAIATCANWIIIMAAIRVGAVADTNLAAYKGSHINPEATQRQLAANISQSLSKIAGLPLLKQSHIQD